MRNLTTVLFVSAALAAGSAALAAPSDRFDLSGWKLTLPEAEAGDDDAAEVEDLAGYEHAEFFFDGADGAMTFVAEAGGETTSGSDYARSELREMRDGDEAAWDLKTGGTMTATLKVDAAPRRHGGAPGRIVIGQIHGEDDELTRLYYECGVVYLVNEHAAPDGKEREFPLLNAAGATPRIALGETFSYLIEARGDRLTVEVRAGGDVYRSETEILADWQDDEFYFKAGVYLGVNAKSGAGHGQASFFALDVGHAPGAGRGGLR